MRLQHGPMATACVELLQRVEAAEELHVARNWTVGWSAAQHDTGATDVVSMVNKRADEISNLARVAKRNDHRWHVPQSWIDRDTLFWKQGDAIICDVWPMAKRDFVWGPKNKVHNVENVHPVPVPPERQPDKQLRTTWETVSPLLPRDAVMAKLSRACQDLTQFQADGEGSGECARCGMHVAVQRHHLIHECPVVQRHWRAAVDAVAALIQKQLKARARLLRAWRGVLLERPPTVPVVYVGWTQPWDHGLTRPAGAAVLPVCVHIVPSQAVVQALQRCIRTDASLLLVHCMRAVYRVQGMEEWTAKDVLAVQRLLPWAGVTWRL